MRMDSVAGIGLAGLLGLAGSAWGDSFSWFPAVSGSFHNPAVWYVAPKGTPDNPNPDGKVPGAQDFVGFNRDAAYTALIDEAAVASTGAGPRLGGETPLLTLNVTGAYVAGIFDANTVLLTGAGVLFASDATLYRMTVRGAEFRAPFSVLATDLEFDDARGDLFNASIATDDPVDPQFKGLLLRNGSLLRTAGDFETGHSGRAGGVTVESGASWEHEGDLPSLNLKIVSGAVRAGTMGRQFSASEVQLDLAALLEVPEFHGHRLLMRGGSRLITTDATLFGASRSGAVLSGSGTSWDVANQFTLNGDMSVQEGARFSTHQVGFDEVANGSVEVTGAGAVWSITGGLRRGTTHVRQGGQATAPTAEDAVVQVSDAGSRFSFNEFLRDGSFSVAGGGELAGGRVELRNTRSYAGGQDSHVNLTGEMRLGMGGSADLTVENQARVDCGTLMVGGQAGGNGTLTLSGPGTLILARLGVFLGGPGSGIGLVNVRNGARLQAGFAGATTELSGIGLGPGSRGTAVVGSAPSAAGAALDLRSVELTGVGVEGAGTLQSLFGGRVLAWNLTAGVDAAGSGRLLVSGPQSTIEVDEQLVIGAAGLGALEVLNQGIVRSRSVQVGDSATTNRVKVESPGSELQVAEQLVVGNAGQGALEILAGGRVISRTADARLGFGLETRSLGSLLVEGAGSRLDFASGVLAAAVNGTATLAVRHGGSLKVAVAELGRGRTVIGTLEVGGVNALVETEQIYVGGLGRPWGTGQVRVSDGGLVRALGEVAVRPGSTLNVTPGGALTIGSASLAPIADTILLGAGGALRTGGRMIGQLVNRGGRLVPGASAGVAAIEGDYEQGADGVLEMEIEGPEPGVLHDVLEVTGSIALDGALELTFGNGFAPAPGQTFTLLKSGSKVLTGAFHTITVNGLAAGFQYRLEPGAEGELRLEALSTATSASAPAEPRLTLNRSGLRTTVTWPAVIQGWTLQSSTNLAPNSWTDREAAQNAWESVPGAPAEFFRLIQR